MFNLLRKKKKESSKNEHVELTGTVTSDEFAELSNQSKIQDNEKEFSFPRLVDNMVNEGITFHKDHFEIQTGLGTIRYGRTFFVKPSGYPSSVRVGWLESLFTGDDLDVSIHVDPYDRTTAIKKLQDKIDELETVYYSAMKRNDARKVQDAQQKIADTENLQSQIKNNRNGLYYVSISATVYGSSLEELNEKCVDIETALGGESIELVNAYGRQKEGFLSTLPLGRNYLKKSYRNLDQLSLTAVFPHSSSKLNHTGGIPIGIYDREYVYFNQFDSKLNNYHLGVFGESGAGKGVFIKQLIGRGPMDGINRHIILDVEPEYIGLTKALGGVVIPIYASKDENVNRINPLDIYPEREVVNQGEPDEHVVEKININEKIKEVMEFFKVMKESCSPGAQGLTPVEIGVLNDILEKLYIDKGITENPESIYRSVEKVNEQGSIEWKREYAEMPTISEVYEALERERENGYSELKELCNVVKLFTRGKAFGLFDGQTRIQMGYDVDLDTVPIITFDISKLSSNGIERPLAQHVLATYAWNRFVISNPKAKKRIIVDEAWMMLKYDSMMSFLQLLAARGRKWNTSLTLVSQRYEMFHRTEAARDIISQLNTVCFLKQSDEDIAPILETFKFSEEVGEMIRTADTGEVVMKTGKEIVAFRSEPTPEEWVYLNTNQNVEVNRTDKTQNLKTREEQIEWLEDEDIVPRVTEEVPL